MPGAKGDSSRVGSEATEAMYIADEGSPSW
jgi:hypothetical protein